MAAVMKTHADQTAPSMSELGEVAEVAGSAPSATFPISMEEHMSDLGESCWKGRRPLVCWCAQEESLRAWANRHPDQAAREAVYAVMAALGRLRDEERSGERGRVLAWRA